MSAILPLFEAGESREVAKRHCRAIGISIRTLEELLTAELDQVGKLKKRGIGERFDQIFAEEVDD